jgi:voltage-gated potassium channel
LRDAGAIDPVIDDYAGRMISARRRLLVAGLYLVALLVLGTAGYMVVEGWSAFDAPYQTVITVSTIGFGEAHPLTTAGRGFTMVLILAGVGGAAYVLSTSVQIAVEWQLGEFFGRRRMRRHIEAMRDHAIICGFGRVGQEIAQDLYDRGAPFVIVESDPAAGARSGQLGYDHIDGNATDDDVLMAAGITHAATLLAASATSIVFSSPCCTGPQHQPAIGASVMSMACDGWRLPHPGLHLTLGEACLV